MEKHLYIKVSEFNYAHPEWFSPNELSASINFSNWEIKILKQHFSNAFHSSRNTAISTLETIFFVVEPRSAMQDWDAINNSKFTLKSEAFFNYLDYLELQEARKISQQAIRSSAEATQLAQKSIFYAKWALILSIVFSICWIIVQIWSTYQPTEINDNQFSEVKNIISSEVKQ